jgi:hypothetical protein
MNFKQFFLERKSGPHHQSIAAATGSKIASAVIPKSMGLVADSIKKEQRKNQKVKRANNNPKTKVPVASQVELKKIIAKSSNGGKININKIGTKGKSLANGVKIKRNPITGKPYLEK